MRTFADSPDWETSCQTFTMKIAQMPFPELPINLCEVQTTDGPVVYVILSAPQTAFKRGLVPKEIVGQLLSPVGSSTRISPDNFGRNPAFVNFLHEVIKKHGPNAPELLDVAKKQGDGVVVVIDGRTPTPENGVPPHDILGIFETRRGEIVPGAYHPNPNHKILTQDGFLRLDDFLLEKLIGELEARN